MARSYELIRQQYLPAHIRILLIAESPPPSADIDSSRHFYRSDKMRKDDRLFTNTIKAIYPSEANTAEATLEQNKEALLRQLQKDGWYMIEALETSQRHETTKQQRQERIRQALPRLIQRLKELVSPDTKIILIKSNVFEVAAEPLRQAGFNVLNTQLVDYPGHYNQRAYRKKLSQLIAKG